MWKISKRIWATRKQRNILERIIIVLVTFLTLKLANSTVIFQFLTSQPSRLKQEYPLPGSRSLWTSKKSGRAVNSDRAKNCGKGELHFPKNRFSCQNVIICQKVKSCGARGFHILDIFVGHCAREAGQAPLLRLSPAPTLFSSIFFSIPLLSILEPGTNFARIDLLIGLFLISSCN